jgi:acyl-CoA thioesterase-1
MRGLSSLCRSAVALWLLNGPVWAASSRCATPPELLAIDPALPHAEARIAAGKSLKIVAIGSSSTSGVGASSPAFSYPNRLEVELEARFRGADIQVFNRGVGRQDVPEEFARLGGDAIDVHPDLIIWQVGTNAVLRRDDIAADARLIERGVSLIRGHGIDLVLMDLQYAPRVLARPAYRDMEQAIAQIAGRARVGLFRRFAVMRYWARTRQLEPAAMIGGDGLHMTDASYGCLAGELAEALAWNWWFHARVAPEARPTAAVLRDPPPP